MLKKEEVQYRIKNKIKLNIFHVKSILNILHVTRKVAGRLGAGFDLGEHIYSLIELLRIFRMSDEFVKVLTSKPPVLINILFRT